ncbi:conserved hypothetical protein [Alkaliphilus metalliredigens QYMF]|uniref:FAD-dependent protein C-terminal domain-containing protein n=1 Tax=Alkaliphilus metalliredigens (strain QYMF) TaxID=293826 RepID=A6TMW9_ALKMQ|nr:hypothetical protein [Alkaliphilus metalliredigens]ABR47537.1 conserved hypothetical protein [Alkaliphilus metalliredigens QYMF]
MLRVPEIKVSLDKGEETLRSGILKKLRIPEADLIDYHIYKQSIDARKTDEVYFVYTVDVKIKSEQNTFKRIKDRKITLTPNMKYEHVKSGDKPLQSPPIVVGMGPSGLLTGLILAEMGYRPILLERGKSVEDRTKDVEKFWQEAQLYVDSNVQFGEGGAGTFSDGKLTTQIKDKTCRKVLEVLIEAGAPKEIMYENKPHVGTDILKGVVMNIRNRIVALGGDVRFESKMTDLVLEKGKIVGIEVNHKEIINTEVVVAALGHSARDTFEMFHERKVNIQQKPFSIGVRIEHPQQLINENQYGSFANHPKLGAADYKLNHHCENGRSAYTFCMCPGGFVVAAASEEGAVVTNGMSKYARNQENANSALLVGVSPEDYGSDHPLAGVAFQRKWEQKAFELGGGNYKAPAQLVKDFLADRPSREFGTVKPSYTPGITLTNLRECLPDYVIEAMREAIVALDKKLKGFKMDDAIMTGVETRSSSPIRIQRDENCESNISGLYPAGEGAGYAGGIVSAAVDGIRVAEVIAKKYAPFR